MSCARLGICRETSLEKVLDSYTCPAYEPVTQESYEARMTAIQTFGEHAAIQAMLPRRTNLNGEDGGDE